MHFTCKNTPLTVVATDDKTGIFTVPRKAFVHYTQSTSAFYGVFHQFFSRSPANRNCGSVTRNHG